MCRSLISTVPAVRRCLTVPGSGTVVRHIESHRILEWTVVGGRRCARPNFRHMEEPALDTIGLHRLSVTIVEPLPRCVFLRRIFSTPCFLEDYQLHRRNVRIEDIKKGNHVVAPPTPPMEPIFHMLFRNFPNYYSSTDPPLPSPLNPHVHSGGVNVL
jgi:hypothetical protein